MTRLPAGLALLMAVGLVLGTDASWPVAALVGVAGVLGLGGLLGDAGRPIGASAGLVLTAYALALALAAPAPGVVVPAGLGVSLTLFVVTGEAGTRARGAPDALRALGAWLLDLVGTAVRAGAVALVAGTVGGSLGLALPAWAYPPLAAAAALAVVAGTGWALIATSHHGPGEHDAAG
jgi:hypothetical protein